MSDHLLRLEDFERVEGPLSLVQLRIRLANQDGPGLSSAFLALLLGHCNPWFDVATSSSGDLGIPLAQQESTISTIRILSICKRVCSMDPTLSEELGREGLHVILTKIMRIDPNVFGAEEDQDILIEIQDLAGEIAATASPFPSLVAPFTNQELTDRLPLNFTVSSVENEYGNSEITTFINQVKERQSSQADVGFLMWPSAVVLSRYLVNHPNELLGKNVLEIGSGCGLTGLVAAQIKTKQEKDTHTTMSTGVLLTDFNRVVVKNCQQNIVLNSLEGIAEAEGLDFYQQDVSVEGWLDSSGVLRDQVDLVLAADVICQPEDAFAAARTIFSALKPRGKALVVSADSKHRFGVDKFEEACHVLDLYVTSEDVRNIDGGRLLTNEMEKTTGYVENMSLTMFTVSKPSRAAGLFREGD